MYTRPDDPKPKRGPGRPRKQMPDEAPEAPTEPPEFSKTEEFKAIVKDVKSHRPPRCTGTWTTWEIQRRWAERMGRTFDKPEPPQFIDGARVPPAPPAGLSPIGFEREGGGQSPIKLPEQDRPEVDV
jgi:hypothetical protein